MRRVRDEAGVSLRDLEHRGTWRRSTISQVENGKARPSRELIEWYDNELGSDGLLVSIYAEARTQQLRTDRIGHDGANGTVGDDVLHVVDVDPPAGLIVGRSVDLRAHLTIANAGARTWRDRRLQRVGAFAGRRLISSAYEVPVPDTEPGGVAEIEIGLVTPEYAGSVIGYWTLVDDSGRPCAPESAPVAVLLVVA